ncbi:MAG: radical SAM protein [Candidatus Acidiferrales bacterium]
MILTEIFKSIQGESTFAGRPCIFIRLTGCNLRCTWCDTAYAFHGGSKYSLDEILAEVERLAGSSIRLAEITGGEPLLQPETPQLARRLLEDGFTTLIETSGESFIGVLPPEVVKIVDVKCPDSGECGTFADKNLSALSKKDEIKFVIASRRDFEFACNFMSEHNLLALIGHIIFSPVFPDPAGTWPALEPRELAEWILAEGIPVRLGLQLHKFIWDPAMKGV